MRRPVSNSALDLAKSLAPDEVTYGVFECTPLPYNRELKGRAYRTRLVSIAEGKEGRPTSSRVRTVPDRHLALRAMTDPSHHKTLIFINTPENDQFEGCTLSLEEGTRTIHLNAVGASQLDLDDIMDLDNIVIRIVKGTGSDKRTTMEIIQDSISL